MSADRTPGPRPDAHRHPTVSADAPGDARLEFNGPWVARALLFLAQACGLEIVVAEVVFDDPAQTISDRLAVKEVLGELDPPADPPGGAA